MNSMIIAPIKHKTSKLKEAAWGYLCVMPLALGLLLFLAAPLVYSLILSLSEYDLFNSPVFVGFDNFKRAFTVETDFWRGVLNALIACTGVVASMAISVLLANLIAKELKGSKVFRMIFSIPTICSAVAITIMWQSIFDFHFGALNNIMYALNLEPINWLGEKTALASLIFIGVWSGLGINILLYLSAIKGVPTMYYEAAKLDGANTFQMFFRITVPSISPVTFYIFVTSLIGVLQDFTKFQVMNNGGGKTTIMPVLIIFNYLGGNYGSFYGYASALAIILGLIIAVITALNFVISRRWVYYES